MTTVKSSIKHLNQKIIDATNMAMRLDARVMELSEEDREEIRGLLNSIRWKTYAVYEMLRCMVINLGGKE